MHIDAHQHFWIYDPREYEWIDGTMTALRRDFLPADLQGELEREGFQGSVAVQARQSLEETRWLLELAGQSPFILGVVGWVDLRSPQVREDLQALARNPKLVGMRHIVQSEPDDRFLLQPDFLRGISLLAEFDLAYDILIYPKHLSVAAEFVRRFPGAAIRSGSSGEAGNSVGSDERVEKRDCGTGGESERILQIVGFGYRSGLEPVEARGHEAVFGCGVRTFRGEPVDDRLGLAGVHGCGIVPARDGHRERLFERAFGAGAGSGAGGQRETLLAAEGVIR